MAKREKAKMQTKSLGIIGGISYCEGFVRHYMENVDPGDPMAKKGMELVIKPLEGSPPQDEAFEVFFVEPFVVMHFEGGPALRVYVFARGWNAYGHYQMEP